MAMAPLTPNTRTILSAVKGRYLPIAFNSGSIDSMNGCFTACATPVFAGPGPAVTRRQSWSVALTAPLAFWMWCKAHIHKRLPDKIISDIIELHIDYHCLVWGIESVQFQEFLRTEPVKR